MCEINAVRWYPRVGDLIIGLMTIYGKNWLHIRAEKKLDVHECAVMCIGRTSVHYECTGHFCSFVLHLKFIPVKNRWCPTLTGTVVLQLFLTTRQCWQKVANDLCTNANEMRVS